MITTKKAIEILEKSIDDPKLGLPEELFLFISRNIPVFGVDLLIKDEIGRTLLSWRNDKMTGTGWHVPGGILRLKDTLEDSVKKVAEREVHTKELKFDSNPLTILQYITNYKERCHTVCLTYKCYLSSSFIPDNKNLNINDAGFLMWHNKCPDNLLETQEYYRKFIDNIF